jgi:glycosyltransferase involved in cell wall biosynthesis
MKICFWGNIAGALMGTTEGGGELQIALLAKLLASIGHEIVIIDLTIAKEFITSDGIKVIGLEEWGKGIKVIRTFTHRFPLLYKLLVKQKADLYYCRIRTFQHIITYLASRKVNAKFLLGLASDLDAMSFKMRYKYFYMTNLHDRKNRLWQLFDGIMSEMIYPWLLRKSDYIFVQHEGQRNLLLKRGISSILFPNLIDLKSISFINNPEMKDFIYVGSLDKRKGFELLYYIINKTPEKTYKIVGQPRDVLGDFYYEKLKSFKNVTLLGKLSHSDTMQEIANSCALISTSQMEGFPNTFIEAWACGIPVFSLYVDPGDVITKEKLGSYAEGDLDKFLKIIVNYKTDNGFSSKAKSYVERVHVINDLKKNKVDSLFRKLISDDHSGTIY